MSDTIDRTVVTPEIVAGEAGGVPAIREAPGSLTAASPTLGALATLEEGLQILERMTALQEALTLALIRVTSPEDWVRSKPSNGPVTALPTKAATSKMARLIGLELGPLPGQADLTPEPVSRAEGKIRGFRVRFQARSRPLGVDWRELETTRWEDEDFTGRTVNDDDKLVFRGTRALDSDLRSAARTAALNKAVREITGLGKVPDALLAQAWGDEKKLLRCQQGHGFGSSKDRAAEGASESGDVRASAAELGNELLRMKNGDTEAAAGLLVSITEDKDGKFGKTSIRQFTAGWQVESAWKRLRARKDYKEYLKQKETAAEPEQPHEREPGED